MVLMMGNINMEFFFLFSFFVNLLICVWFGILNCLNAVIIRMSESTLKKQKSLNSWLAPPKSILGEPYNDVVIVRLWV